MIAKDQPTIFGDKIAAGVSSVDDGNMKKKGMPEELQKQVDPNRKKFLQSLGISPEQTVLVRLTYDKDNFAVYETVNIDDKGKGIVYDGEPFTDALATSDKNVALFLPIADCVGAIIYDPIKEVVMVSHLGRHSTEQHGGTKSIQYLAKQFGCNPADILVYFSPSPNASSYPLFKFENRSLHDINKEHFTAAGVKPDNIEICDVDTSSDTNYFSYSEFIKGNREVDGRFAIVAMML
ncbi:MAG: polyphenol oxidase family protein [Candidatus Saccharibacteria bacterium]|nr:polyphenol oxidase family protein [Candidatus Saccharibacteria bacterium]